MGGEFVPGTTSGVEPRGISDPRGDPVLGTKTGAATIGDDSVSAVDPVRGRSTGKGGMRGEPF